MHIYFSESSKMIVNVGLSSLSTGLKILYNIWVSYTWADVSFEI